MSHFALRAAAAGALMMVGAAGASAADLNHYTAAPVAPTNIVSYAFNWTGAYVGANIGANWETVTNPYGTSSAFTGGLQAGYLWQTGQIVYGLEGSVDYNGNSRTRNFQLGGVGPVYGDREKLDWDFGVRGRLGYAFDRFLPFVSAGITFANLHSRVTDTATGVTDSNSTLRTGFQVGGGLEYAFTNNVTARGEYIFSDYGGHTVGYGNNGFALHHDVTDNALRFSINYKF
jgi:outer membrane immunogenic protein